MLLRLDKVTTYYGEIRILEEVSIEVGAGEVVCLLGGNASGKSTTLKTALGLVKPRCGTVEFDGEDVTDRSPSYRIKRGMAIVPENRRLFAPMTVAENLEMGAHLRDDDPIGVTRRACTSSSRGCTSGAPSWPERSRAASSRCWRWAGR